MPRIGIGALLPGAILAAIALAGSARGDQRPSLALEPAPAGDAGFSVERAEVEGDRDFAARLLVDYADRPLVLLNSAQERDPLLATQVWVHALGTFRLAHRFAFSADVPFALMTAGPSAPSGAAMDRPPGAARFGDLRFGARAVLAETPLAAPAQAAVAVSTTLWLPTGGDFAGDGSARGAFALVADGSTKWLYWAFSGGVRLRPFVELPGILPVRVGSAIALGGAAGFFADEARAAAFGCELAGVSTFGGGTRLFDPRGTSAQLSLTGRYRLAGGPFEVGVAVGPGFGQGAGAADFRAIGFAGYAPGVPRPPPDRDHDGVPDEVDACPTNRGVPSPDPLLNGCPEHLDSDGDGILDEYDDCPTEFGEPTFEKGTHGCPRAKDTDRDGIPDVFDHCPTVPGVRSPDPLQNGCPAPPPKATLIARRIEISQQLRFEVDTARLDPASDAILGEVARLLAEHPEIELCEVQGHTDDTGSAAHNRILSRERAESVVFWLERRGVRAARLTAKGYGADLPLADNASDEGRAKNRRVDFVVLRMRGEP